MTINLITPEQHETLLNIQKEFPKLTFQNKGYQKLDISKLNEEETDKLKEVSEILKKVIIGFSSFNHFKLDNRDEIRLRFQYNYGADDKEGHYFIGVGYIYLDELLNGFKK